MKTTNWLMAVRCIGVITLTVAPAGAEDWPQWQGPDRNAISKERGLLQQWPEGGPALDWKTDRLGGGDSAPAIVGGRIYLMSNRGDDEVVIALSEKDGSEVWVRRLGPAHSQRASQSKEGPGCTPTVDGEHIYVEGLAGNVVCLQAKDGEIVWQRSMVEDFGGQVPMWSYRESPLVDGDKVICTPGVADATLVALNKRTGETVWKGRMAADSAAGSESPAGRPGAAGGAPSRPGGGAAATVSGTKDAALFTSEHFGMTAFSCKVPNGKYVAKLYFAETYEGITGPGQRVFSFKVQERAFNDFDIWVKAGGPNRAYIETVPVAVTAGECRIVFTPKVENPAIKAIELTPQAETGAGAGSPDAGVRINAGVSEPFTDSSGRVWQPDSGFDGGMMSQMSGGGRRYGAGRGGFGRSGGSGGPRAAYASPIAIDFDGQRQYVQLISNALVAFAASDGTFLWRYDKPANRMGINCSTPIHHDGMVFAASAYGAGGGLVKLRKDADGGVRAEEVYSTSEMENHHGGMVLVDGYLYGANGGNGGGALVCLEFQTGKVRWDQSESAGRRAKGSVVVADGRLYYRMEDGTVLLIEPDPERYIEHGRFEQPDRTRQPAWAHPVIANGKLYIRDQDVLRCYHVAATDS